jgi:hypothetical protein
MQIAKGVHTKWENHEFYSNKTLVLGLDIGIQGIGVWLRRGRKPIFGHTFLVSLPAAAPLKERRSKRAWKHARQSRERRERMLQKWIVRHGLLAAERVREKWNNPAVFDRAFDHRHRAITSELGSPEALVVCIRHVVKHRGYDYHLTEEGTYPWGDELDDRAILEWAKRAPCAPVYRASLLAEIQSDAPWAKDAEGKPTEKYLGVETALAEAVRTYEDHPIEKLLERHVREKGHPNRREPARGHNFPRELIKQHLLDICAKSKHRNFFAAGQFETAMRELLGEQKPGGIWTSSYLDAAGIESPSILDYHRRTPEEAEALWLRKTKDCPFAARLHEQKKISVPKAKRDLRADPRVRRFNLSMFLAERGVELANNQRVNLTATMVKEFLDDLEQDIKAAGVLLDKKTRQDGDIAPERAAKPGKKSFEKRFPIKLAGVGKDSFNEDFFDVLGDHLRPELRKLRDRASLCGESAEALYQMATNGGTNLEPAAIRQALRECGYYDWRKDQERGLGIFPQVEFLLGQRKHYDGDGKPRDTQGRKDGQAQHHGILRKLFAGQLRLDDGTVVNLTDELDGKTAPDYVVVETIGDIPRNEQQRIDQKKEIKANRERKQKIIKDKYGLNPNSLSDSQIRRVLLFDQQANDEGEAFSPYTHESLGKAPLSDKLQIDHIYPESRGGIGIMDNLAITTIDENKRKDKRTPFEWARDESRKVDAHLAAMHWNKTKRALFCREEEECPQWDNTTRMAQLARHLRNEVIHWLGIRRESKDDEWVSNEIARRIGTPTGFMTGACRDTWAPPDVFPKLYREMTDAQGRTRQIKNRDNLRHHLWDAAVLSHIPPGVGMNSASYGGIFLEGRNPTTGDPKTTALAGLGPNLDAFEKATADRCLVSRPRQAKSKKSRYKQTILSPPDAEGKMWAREPLDKYTGKKNQTLAKVRALLDRPGLLQPMTTKKGKIVQLLRPQDIEAWWDGVQDVTLDQSGFLELLEELGVVRTRVPDAALAENFPPGKPQRKFAAKALLAFLRKKCGVLATELPDSRVEDVLAERAARAILRANNGKNGQPGQPIRSVRIEQDQQAFSGPHFTPGGKEQIGGRKAVDNSTTVTYLRREIWIGSRFKPKGKKGKPDVTETYYKHRLIPHPRHLAAHEKITEKKWKTEPLPEGMEFYDSLAVGDLLRVPFAADYSVARKGEPAPGGAWFFRVSALKSDKRITASDGSPGIQNGEVELSLAEYDEPKIKEGHRPTPEQERLIQMNPVRTRSDEDLVWLIEFTRGKTTPIPPPVPLSASIAKHAPAVSSSPQTELGV